MSKPNPPTYILTIRPEPAGPDKFGREPSLRLRLLLKQALRIFGMRAISIQESDTAEQRTEH